MKADIDIQIVWNENKGEVQLFIGDFRIGLPPETCAQLEKELAAARRVPERAREMAENEKRIMYGPSGGAMSDTDTIRLAKIAEPEVSKYRRPKLLLYCDCDMADECPQGKTGMAAQCAILVADGSDHA
jgi:hypothetical protein